MFPDFARTVLFVSCIFICQVILCAEFYPIVRSISPSRGSFLGGTKIRVIGDNFHRSTVQTCLFWGNEASVISNVSTDLIEISSVSQYISSTEVICISPASKKSHDVHLLLFANEDIASFEGTLQSRGRQFHYYEEIKISTVIPELAQTSGNTTINIFGGLFHSGEGLLCLFGGIPTPAAFISSTQIRCQTPPHAIGTYPLEISQNGQDFTRSMRAFEFYHPTRVQSIHPTCGPAKQAGTKVNVQGDNFVNSTSLRCRFGTSVVPAVFVSSSQMYCYTPPTEDADQSWLTLPDQKHERTMKQLFLSSHAYPRYSGKLASFEITNNGQDFTDSGSMFLYQADINVVAISSSKGPSRGGTPVFISGTNFVNTTKLSCRFGSQESKAHFLTRESILCFSTPIYGQSYRNSYKQKSFAVLVSNNAIDYSYAGEFTYTSLIPPGMYQAGVEVRHMLECPRGCYCTDILETNFTLCSPGTYQPSLSQSRCLPCPIGYVCSEFGLLAPILCPAGYGEYSVRFLQPPTSNYPHLQDNVEVCNERGMSHAKPCPTGFWCDRGTATSDTECFNSDVLSSDVIKTDTSFSNIGTCFDNSTDDFGLQSSDYPAEFWSERHLMHLDSDAAIQPIRGKYCLEDSCLKLEDSHDVEVYDEYFDYSATGIALRRPHVCTSGHYCNAGTAVGAESPHLASPKVCSNGIHCAEGSSNPKGIGVCMPGFYCRLGIKRACPVATYCPDDNVFDPLPCEPGSFNFMIGQEKCSICPNGYICPTYGMRDPIICPPGFVCSRKGLVSPNIRCPAGFYCQNGTQTSDPFRNDTTLRPYACSPGTYCLAGTGYNEVRGDSIALSDNDGGYTALYAQPCASGFFCEAASISAKGSGPCPPGFICPKGTANPRPTPKGFFAEHIGTVEATACLPGFYSPTIENEKCYTCPPGTSCSIEGLWEAEECPPGTYRSTTEADGFGCVSCPQGTWSKNWQLREKGECTRCPTGVVCPLDGMTNPCSFSDLPTPFEPIVNFKGMPAYEYDFPHELILPFSMDECLALNSVSNEFFFGELIPPYIDVLGRGPHFRPSDQQSLKYQSQAKCYKNSQPEGSLVYQRMADYYGPQFDIQSGYPHQGYGSAALLNQMIATAPPPGYDFGLRYGYFRGRGHGYIDLPKARTFDPLFNCTKGFKLLNSSLVTEDSMRRIVYTDAPNDFEGGYDIEQCSTWDDSLGCYIDERYEVHPEGECCHIDKYQQRAIFFADDQFYEGTCEADRICSEGRSASPQAKACDDGHVCDEGTSLETSMDHPCTAGYICDFATTPDTTLYAPNGQFSRLCKEGHFCSSGTGTKENLAECPKNYYCPTGTADPYTGALANDGMLRLLAPSNKYTNMEYQGGDMFTIQTDHGRNCNAATRSNLDERFVVKIQDDPNVNQIEYLSQNDKTSFSVREAINHEMQCGRDNKSFFIRDAVRRRDCNCRRQFLTIAAVYRFWKCTSDDPLDNFSFADPSSLNGKRDYWFPGARFHKDYNTAIQMDPSMEMFGIKWGSGSKCKFEGSNSNVGLNVGKLPFDDSGYLEFDRHNVQFSIQFTYMEHKSFDSYSELKESATTEYLSERKQIQEGARTNIDPFIFDLYRSIQLIEQHGEKLEKLIEVQPANAPDHQFIGALDWCECQSLLKCPNGTVSKLASTAINDCISTKDDVLSRISLISNSTDEVSTSEGTIDDSPTLNLDPYQIAVLTIDQSGLPTNFTYGEHYQISVYDGCKPCPLRYQCDVASSLESPESSCKYPSIGKQVHHVNQCLKENKKTVCILPDGSYEAAETCLSNINATDQNGNPEFLLISDPDIELCLSRPYTCQGTRWNFRSFRRLCQDMLPNGEQSAIYDCVNVHQWSVYNQWRDSVCCNSPQVPELRGIDSCTDDFICAADPSIEEIIRDKMINVFELEYGFTPPLEKPLGQILWNTTLQEGRQYDTPLDLFNEWQSHFDAKNYLDFGELHNQFKPEMSEPWISTQGCCKCKRHTMPYTMDTNTATSGFPDDKHKAIQISISALTRVELTVTVELLHGYYYADFADYFGPLDKSTLRVHTPSRFAESLDDKKTVLSILEKSTFDDLRLDLPLNLPINLVHGKKEVETRFLLDRSDFAKSYYNSSSSEANYESNVGSSTLPDDPIDLLFVDYDWNSHDFFALPYIPFFSNCDGYGSHISWSRLLEEHPDCLSVNHNDVVPINEFSFRNIRMNNDACHGISLHCNYEEEVKEARENIRWYEASSGSTLFYLTRDAVPSSHFVPSDSYGYAEQWGRTQLLNQLRNSYDVIPLIVDKEMSGYRHAIPRHIELELKYFQTSTRAKRFVEARLYYDDFCTTEDAKSGSSVIIDAMSERGIIPCEVDINGIIKTKGYDLEVSYYPLNWFDLLNRFEFKVSVYFLLYTVMGLAVCTIGSLVFGTNKILTKLRHPPRFQGLSLINLVTRPQLEGCALALIPYMTIVSLLNSCFGTNNTSSFGLDNVHSKWANTGLINSTQVIDNSVGRLGSSLLVLGFWIINKGIQKLIPISGDKANHSQSDIISKRSHLIAISFCVQGAMLCFMEFSYSEHFKTQIYTYVVLFRICSFGFDMIMTNMIKEKLLMAPLMVLIQMTEMLITIGARDFLEFSMAFFVKVAMLVALRLFIYPLMKTASTLWPRWKMLVDQAVSSKGLTRQQKKDRELMWKKINEEIELRTEGIEPLLDAVCHYSIEKVGTIMVPFMCLMLMYLYPETEIAHQYGINQHELLYYGTFAFYMIPWMSIVDAFIFSSQELLYGWRVYDYFSYQRWRYYNREQRWNLLAQVDESVTPSLQSIDVMCFSSQYYFILAALTLGFGTNIFGVTICLRRQYSFLGDPIFPLIVATVVMSCELLYALCIYISDLTIDAIAWDGVWKTKQLQGTMDDVVAAKLAIGEGRQEDLERERQEYLAMNSETFRHKFIEKNRPWVLQHLVELITPRTLQDHEAVGPDGRPLVDYVRDVYSNLMTVGEGARRSSERSDISSDGSSDDEFELRRKWDRTPLDGSKLLIAQIWLQKARKRRVFMKAISTIIEKRKEDHCLVCSRSLSSCSTLSAGLAWDGKFDPNAIDCMIKVFEEKYSPTESDPTLWKAFFRETAEFTTICNICLDGVEQKKLHKDVRHVGAGRPSRPGDISSDDESEDEVYFEPVIRVRSSKEGQIMKKWCNAARVRVGGRFPRNGAERQSQLYLDRLKRRAPIVIVANKGEKMAHTTKSDIPKFKQVELNSAGAVMIKRWLRHAKEISNARFEEKALETRSQLKEVLAQMPIDFDWYFGMEMRLDGGALKIEGEKIQKEKERKEALLSKQIQAMKVNLDHQVLLSRQKQKDKKETLEQTLIQSRNKGKQKKDQRGIELNRALDERPSEAESLREMALEEETREDQRQIKAENSMMEEAEAYIAVIEREIHSATQKYMLDFQTIRERIQQEYMSIEISWQKNVRRWLGKATKKINAKVALDTQKVNSPPITAKKAKLERRKNKDIGKRILDNDLN